MHTYDTDISPWGTRGQDRKIRLGLARCNSSYSDYWWWVMVIDSSTSIDQDYYSTVPFSMSEFREANILFGFQSLGSCGWEKESERAAPSTSPFARCLLFLVFVFALPLDPEQPTPPPKWPPPSPAWGEIAAVALHMSFAHLAALPCAP
jgi:hypothetical protein